MSDSSQRLPGVIGSSVQRFQNGKPATPSQPQRLAEGGVIDRHRTLTFKFDDQRYHGHPGDTLASALLANGVRLVGRSFKYHRPRGLVSCGVEEPNALVELRSGARREPNTRTPLIELFDGLEAHSQNRWPSLKFDVGEINDKLSSFFSAGFYYKTFMWPASFWEKYEVVIRHAAGMGSAARIADPDHYDHKSAHCELLIVGGGVAGLTAARAAAESGQRVILVEEHPRWGGWLWRQRDHVEGRPAMQWLADTVAALEAHPAVTMLTRTTAFGYYDDNFVAAVERVQDHVNLPDPHRPRQRIWQIRARQVILATGAIEQPLLFADNDRPGIMQAGAVRAYLHGYGVLAGRRVVLMTNNDDAYRSALDLQQAGAEVTAVLDLRSEPQGDYYDQARAAGLWIMPGYGITRVEGRLGVSAVQASPLSGSGPNHHLACDLVASSGGWAPTLHLHSQSGGKAEYLPGIAAFGPGAAKQNCVSVGACAGRFHLVDCLSDGEQAGLLATGQASSNRLSMAAPGTKVAMTGVREVRGGRGKCFIDQQHDVSVDDIELAHREGFLAVEHLKRYTTLGMATDQGKTSNLAGLSIMARLRGMEIPQVGTTTFRPPYTPVTIGALAGDAVGRHYKPLRRSPLDVWHTAHGVRWIDAGLWRRSHYYPQGTETIGQAAIREVQATRNGVGICDVSPLGKIDIQGPDAGEFLNRIYSNGWKSLAVGKARYGLMLREDGIVLDDGTTSRLGDHHYHMTTTTANAVPVMALLEYYLQAVWPELRVQVTSVTDQWAGMSIAGPASRQLLAKLVDIDISNEAFPFMAVAECQLGPIPARLFRISFSGELAYEVNVAADYGEQAWELIMAAGSEQGISAYGLEALGTMRIEKGHVAGPELNGRTTLADLGLAKMASAKKAFIGKTLQYREHLQSPDRQQLVGLIPADGKTMIRAGSQLISGTDGSAPVKMYGHVTSVAYSPTLGHPIALALLEGGLKRYQGKTFYAAFPLRQQTVLVRVVSPHFVDPEGSRQYV